jgi:hypothetical protein
MLRDARMAGLVKLHRGMGTVGRVRLWAVRVDGLIYTYFNLAQNEVLRS